MGSGSRRRKIAGDWCDSDGDKPSSQQTRSPHSAGWRREAKQLRAARESKRSTLSSTGKRANIKSFLAMRKTIA